MPCCSFVLCFVDTGGGSEESQSQHWWCDMAPEASLCPGPALASWPHTCGENQSEFPWSSFHVSWCVSARGILSHRLFCDSSFCGLSLVRRIRTDLLARINLYLVHSVSRYAHHRAMYFMYVYNLKFENERKQKKHVFGVWFFLCVYAHVLLFKCACVLVYYCMSVCKYSDLSKPFTLHCGQTFSICVLSE